MPFIYSCIFSSRGNDDVCIQSSLDQPLEKLDEIGINMDVIGNCF